MITKGEVMEDKVTITINDEVAHRLKEIDLGEENNKKILIQLLKKDKAVQQKILDDINSELAELRK